MQPTEEGRQEATLCGRSAQNGGEKWERRPHGGQPVGPGGTFFFVMWVMQVHEDQLVGSDVGLGKIN